MSRFVLLTACLALLAAAHAYTAFAPRAAVGHRAVSSPARVGPPNHTEPVRCMLMQGRAWSGERGSGEERSIWEQQGTPCAMPSGWTAAAQ
jgi:hypothetical protein